jgi:hypothetical protein
VWLTSFSSFPAVPRAAHKLLSQLLDELRADHELNAPPQPPA